MKYSYFNIWKHYFSRKFCYECTGSDIEVMKLSAIEGC